MLDDISDLDRIVLEYKSWLREDRGLAPATIETATTATVDQAILPRSASLEAKPMATVEITIEVMR